MEPAGRIAFESNLGGVVTFLEYGCGGSTLLALERGVRNVISVDSDLGWVERVRIRARTVGAILHLSHCDIGPVGEWGYPVGWSRTKAFYQYSTLPWQVARQHNLVPELVLIDGRFRVSSFLYTLVAAREGTPILFDDYRDRPEYHVVEKFCDVSEMHGRMAVFKASRVQALAEFSEALMKFSVDPA